MTVLDSYAVLALLKDEPSAAAVGKLVRLGGRLTAVGVSEVLDHLIRIVDADDDAVLDLAELGLLEAEPVDASLGTRAGVLRAKHYHRTKRAVSLADCVAARPPTSSAWRRSPPTRTYSISATKRLAPPPGLERGDLVAHRQTKLRRVASVRGALGTWRGRTVKGSPTPSPQRGDQET